jgi:7-keto-8-aminopelargonate synthetase-like enzyme
VSAARAGSVNAGSSQRTPSPANWRSWAEAEAEAIREAGQWRAVRDFDARGPAGSLGPDGREVVAFASNDYLGLTTHPEVITAAQDALERWGAGAGAARLIVGSRPVHSELERELAAWKRCEDALLFPTGFAANLAVLATFGVEDSIVCSDQLNHASIVDGCRLARARTRVYPHRDVDALEAHLRDAGRAIVVSETVFSMRSCASASGIGLCWCSTRPTPCSGPTRTSGRRTRCGSGRSRRPSARSAGTSPARRG